MDIQIAITLVLLVFISVTLLWFFNERKTMARIHQQNIAVMKEAIHRNQCQVNFRDFYLNKYNFLKYNLAEALTIQPEVINFK